MSSFICEECKIIDELKYIVEKLSSINTLVLEVKLDQMEEDIMNRFDKVERLIKSFS